MLSSNTEHNIIADISFYTTDQLLSHLQPHVLTAFFSPAVKIFNWCTQHKLKIMEKKYAFIQYLLAITTSLVFATGLAAAVVYFIN